MPNGAVLGFGTAALNCENRGRLTMIASGRIPGLKVDGSRENQSWCGLHYELNGLVSSDMTPNDIRTILS
jgi:hypothetical protein